MVNGLVFIRSYCGLMLWSDASLGDASAGPATAFFSIPSASLSDASAAPSLGDINHASMAPGALAGAIDQPVSTFSQITPSISF